MDKIIIYMEDSSIVEWEFGSSKPAIPNPNAINAIKIVGDFSYGYVHNIFPFLTPTVGTSEAFFTKPFAAFVWMNL